MGKDNQTETPETPAPPKLVRRRENRKSAFRIGRTIGEARERLETANERMAARKKQKQKKALRVIFTILGFLVLIAILIGLYLLFFKDVEPVSSDPVNQDYASTIEIIDENSAMTHEEITSRMSTFISQVETEFHALSYKPTKAVIPTGSIREVDFYLEGYDGFLKMVIDRGAAVSVEDADRMIRYLSEAEIDDFEYIDVRIDGKAYWK